MNDLDLRNLMPDSMDDIRRLLRWLDRVAGHLDAMPTPFDDIVSIDGANRSVEGAKSDLEKARDAVSDIRNRLVEYTRIIERMAAQRQSAIDAYDLGYKARFIDLIAQLSGPEYFALRQALQNLDEDGQIPF